MLGTRFRVPVSGTLALLAGCASASPAIRSGGGTSVALPAATTPVRVTAVAAEPRDSSTLRIAAGMVRAADTVDRIWPGFWPRARNFMIVLDDRPGAILVTTRRAPEGYDALEAAALPRELRGRAYYRGAYPDGVTKGRFSLALPVGDDTVVAMYPFGSRDLSRYDFYYHEAFHGHQERAYAPVPGEPRGTGFKQPSVPPEQVADAEFARGAEAERRALAAAMAAAPAAVGPRVGDATRRALLLYLGMRHARTAGRPQVIAMERMRERVEGVATYVGTHAAAAATGMPADTVRAHLARELAKSLQADYDDFPESDARLMRWRLYGTGGSMAYLLDRLGVAWKPAIAAGSASLDELVARAVGFRESEAAALAAEGRTRFGG